jgi:prophage regulatory protein
MQSRRAVKIYPLHAPNRWKRRFLKNGRTLRPRKTRNALKGDAMRKQELSVAADGETAFWRCPMVRKQCGLSRSTVWRLMRRGQLPQPVQISDNSVGWVSSEVESWISARIAARRAQ